MPFFLRIGSEYRAALLGWDLPRTRNIVRESYERTVNAYIAKMNALLVIIRLFYRATRYSSRMLAIVLVKRIHRI
jgi:hypothetical protein